MLPILERATQNYPDDEDIALEAFVHFLRVGETRLAQRVSPTNLISLEEECRVANGWKRRNYKIDWN